ncbi:MAG: hypothetical protein PHX70_06940 [Clostridium sp.]|nr:hypothetical protein [Clostridium sp.]
MEYNRIIVNVNIDDNPIILIILMSEKDIIYDGYYDDVKKYDTWGIRKRFHMGLM